MKKIMIGLLIIMTVFMSACGQDKKTEQHGYTLIIRDQYGNTIGEYDGQYRVKTVYEYTRNEDGSLTATPKEVVEKIR